LCRADWGANDIAADRMVILATSTIGTCAGLNKIEAVSAIQGVHEALISVRMIELATGAIIAFARFEVVLAIGYAIANRINDRGRQTTATAVTAAVARGVGSVWETCRERMGT
jgi:2-keto-3-deoxy-L-rhamnonate aldolase RhmA